MVTISYGEKDRHNPGYANIENKHKNGNIYGYYKKILLLPRKNGY
jgi:hypothetical protein